MREWVEQGDPNRQNMLNILWISIIGFKDTCRIGTM